MTRIQILVVVVLVSGVAAIGCYWFWASSPPAVGVEKGTAWTPSQPQQRDSREDEETEGPIEAENARKGPQPDDPNNQNGDAAKIQTAQQAIEAANTILGWENGGDYTAEKVTITKCFVPFIGKEVNGKTGWKLRLSGITLKLKRNPPKGQLPYKIELEAENPYVKQFQCLILAETGQLLYIESTIPKGVTIKPDRIPLEEAEDRYGYERIKAFPKEPSQLPFREILNRAFEAHGSWVSTAKQIIAFYVVDSYGKNEEIRPPQPLWLIYVRGFSPPFALPSGGGSLRGQKKVDPGTIDYMRLPFTPDGKEFGGGNMVAPK